MKDCKYKINKKSFQKLCRDKLDILKIQVCRTEIEELIYDLGICKDEKIDYTYHIISDDNPDFCFRSGEEEVHKGL